MAAISWKLLKVGALVGTIPAIGIGVGYQMRSAQALESRTQESRVFRVSEIPVYNTSKEANTTVPVTDLYPRNALETEIGSIRRTVQDIIHSGTETYQMIEDKVNIGIAHSQATIDYLQNDTNELVRIVSITVSGLGGIVLGYRGSIIRKVLYASIGSGAMASLCYPKASVEMSEQLYNQAVDLYEYIFSESTQEKEEKVVLVNLQDDKALNLLANDVAKDISDDTSDQVIAAVTDKSKVQLVKGDPGQSNPADKDMYSTRSS